MSNLCKNVFEAILKYGHDEDFDPIVDNYFLPTDAPAGSQEKIEVLQKDLAALLGASPSSAASADKPAKKKRTMSAAARKKIAAAQRARWAKQKAAAPDKKSK